MNTMQYLPEATNDRVFALIGSPWSMLAVWLVIINVVTFLVFGLDKWKAKRKVRREQVRRVPEKTLFLLAALGGGLGALIGMRVWHHKTLHRSSGTASRRFAGGGRGTFLFVVAFCGVKKPRPGCSSRARFVFAKRSALLRQPGQKTLRRIQLLLVRQAQILGHTLPTAVSCRAEPTRKVSGVVSKAAARRMTTSMLGMERPRSMLERYL